MSRSHRTAAALASIAALAGTTTITSVAIVPAAHAASLATVTVNPKRPIVDDSISASMTVTTRLKAGYHYEVAIIGASGYECSRRVFKSLKNRPAKGKKLTFGFDPYEDETSESSEWCQGKATIFVTALKNGKTTGGKLVGLEEIRFRAKP